MAKAGDEVTVQYVGVGYQSGKEFDASWDRGQPFGFQLGAGQVIKGWDEGVQGMKVGGRRELLIPPGLAYGAAGSPPSIGANETLIFVIDLVSVKKPEAESTKPGPYADSPIAKRPKPKVPVPQGPPPKKVVIKDLKEGTGEAVEAGDKIVVNYVGVNYETGKEFEATWNTTGLVTFQLGAGEVIKGWEQGMLGMKVGGRRELIIPSKLAFERGVVVYVIDLVAIE